jgi:hypothetical protein
MNPIREVAIREKIKFDTHVLDPENKLSLGKAKKNCRHCYGTGMAGRMPMLGGIKLVCKCVARQTRLDEEILAKKAAEEEKKERV